MMCKGINWRFPRRKFVGPLSFDLNRNVGGGVGEQ